MKTYILATLTAVTIAAHAQPFAETDNQGGGKIVLLTDPCPTTPTESRAYFYIKDGTTEDGCWKYDADTVVAVWERQGKRRYPISYFKLRGHFRDFK